MIHHEAAILNDFNPGFCKCLGHALIVNSRLHPNCFRHLRQNIFDVRRNILRSAKDVDKIDLHRNVDEPAKDLFTKNSRRVGVVNRHWNYLESGGL